MALAAGNKDGGEVEVIHSWSAPRSLSTGLMYSFSQVSHISLNDSSSSLLPYMIRLVDDINLHLEG